MNAANYHRNAMALCDEADAAIKAGDMAMALVKFEQAFRCESHAIGLQRNKLEPTYSVLIRSAASILIQMRHPERAIALINRRLERGGVPAEIEQELCELLHTATEYVAYYRLAEKPGVLG
jgi:hypothetical protein